MNDAAGLLKTSMLFLVNDVNFFSSNTVYTENLNLDHNKELLNLNLDFKNLTLNIFQFFMATNAMKRADNINLEDRFFEKYKEFIKAQGGSQSLLLKEKLSQVLNPVPKEDESYSERTQILQEEQCVATQKLQRVRFEVANLSQRLTALKDQQKHLRKEISVLQSRDALLDTLNKQCEAILGLSGPFAAIDEARGQKKCFMQFDSHNAVLIQMTQQCKLQMDTIKKNIAKIRGESHPDLKVDPEENNQKQENLKKFLENKKEAYWARVQKCKEKRTELEVNPS